MDERPVYWTWNILDDLTDEECIKLIEAIAHRLFTNEEIAHILGRKLEIR